MKAKDGLTNEQRGFCVNGDPWIPENIVVCGTEKKRKCRLCRRRRDKKRSPARNKKNRILPSSFRDQYYLCGQKKNRRYLKHPKTPENTITYPNGEERCLICVRALNEKRRAGVPALFRCLFCDLYIPDHLLYEGMRGRPRKYCSTYCLDADKPSGYQERAEHYGCAYEPITRGEILRRFGTVCRHCGKLCDRYAIDVLNKPTVDHILPLKLGGGHIWPNLQILCGDCNFRKSASMYMEPKLRGVTDLAQFIGSGKFSAPGSITGDCPECETWFTSSVLHQIYCSTKCGERARHRRNRQNKRLKNSRTKLAHLIRLPQKNKKVYKVVNVVPVYIRGGESNRGVGASFFLSKKTSK